MTKKDWLKIWVQERDEAIRTQDVETFKAFYEKWRNRGFYQMPLLSDEVIEVSLRKMLYNIKNATDEEKAEAKKWLAECGFSTDIGE